MLGDVAATKANRNCVPLSCVILSYSVPRIKDAFSEGERPGAWPGRRGRKIAGNFAHPSDPVGCGRSLWRFPSKPGSVPEYMRRPFALTRERSIPSTVKMPRLCRKGCLASCFLSAPRAFRVKTFSLMSLQLLVVFAEMVKASARNCAPHHRTHRQLPVERSGCG